MDTTKRNKTPMQAKTLAELLPDIRAILSQQAILSLTAQKQARSGIHQTHTNVKNIRPMTIAEIKALNLFGKVASPKRALQASKSKSKPWNSSVKVNKTKPLTADGQLKHTTARKMLTFQQKNPRLPVYSKTTMISSTANEPVHTLGTTHISDRISGVCKMPETPALKTLGTSGLKLSDTQNNPPTLLLNGEAANTTFESNCDQSFLQKEKEINDFEAKCNGLIEEFAKTKIADVSPPVSTPFKQYRDVRDYFDHAENDNSVLLDVTNIIDQSSKEVSLCEILNNVTLSAVNNNNNGTNLDNVLATVEKHLVNNLLMIDSVLKVVKQTKAKQLKIIDYIQKLRHEKAQTMVDNKNNEEKNEKKTEDGEENFCENNPVKNVPKVSKAKLPSYKIPRKSSSLRKGLLCKSMSDGMATPKKNTDRALKHYMQIKGQMTFLNTPLTKHRQIDNPDTPAVTSFNLRKQLDKLYNE